MCAAVYGADMRYLFSDYYHVYHQDSQLHIYNEFDVDTVAAELCWITSSHTVLSWSL